MSEVIIAGVIKWSDLQNWIEPSPLDTDLGKLTLIGEGVVSDAEDYIHGKIKKVTDEVTYLDGGKTYLTLPHLNVSSISIWEDIDRTFGSSTLLDPTKYQVYGPRGILRIGKPKHPGMGGIAWMDKFFSDYYWDDFWFDKYFEGRREFLHGRLVIKSQYNGGWDQDTVESGLKLALITQIGYRYRRRKDPGLSTVSYPDGSVTKMMNIDQWLPEVKASLNKYKRISLI
jgi:hypothetical protein